MEIPTEINEATDMIKLRTVETPGIAVTTITATSFLSESSKQDEPQNTVTIKDKVEESHALSLYSEQVTFKPPRPDTQEQTRTIRSHSLPVQQVAAGEDKPQQRRYIIKRRSPVSIVRLPNLEPSRVKKYEKEDEFIDVQMAGFYRRRLSK